MLKICNLSAGYGRKNVLKNVSFSLDDGSVTGLLGANGCGKTTLLKAVCGILPHEGGCYVDETALQTLSGRALARLVSYIPQRSGITIDLTAQEVVEMGFNPHLGLLQQPTRQMKETARQMLEKVAIPPEQNYLQLSEGQKQMCILARTLVSEANVLVMDEPESALDLKNRYGLFELLRQAAPGKTVLAALHDPQLALQVCDRLILLCGGTVGAVLYPKTDELSHMEKALCRIYGKVKLHKMEDTLVMYKTGGSQ